MAIVITNVECSTFILQRATLVKTMRYVYFGYISYNVALYDY